MPIDGTVQQRPISGGSVTSGAVPVGGVTALRASLTGAVQRSVVGISGSFSTSGHGDGVADGLINVKESPYLAVGDGVANDTVPLQQALAASEATSGKTPIYFPPGTYRITSALTPFTGMRLLAFGRGSEFSHGTIIKNLTTSMFTPTADISDIDIQGIQFIGNTDTTATDFWTVGTGFDLNYSYIDRCGFTGFKRIYSGDWTGVNFTNFYVNGSNTQYTQFDIGGADNLFGPGFLGSSGFNRTTLSADAPAHATPNTITVTDATGAFVGGVVYIGNQSNGASATRDISIVTNVSGNQLTIGTLTNSHVAGEYVHIVLQTPAVDLSFTHSLADRLYISPGPGMAMHVTGGHSSVFFNNELSGAPAVSAGPGLYVIGGQGHQFIGTNLSSVANKAWAQFNGAVVIYDSVDLSFIGTHFGNINSFAPNIWRLGRSGNVGVQLTDNIQISGTNYYNISGTAVKMSGNAPMTAADRSIDFDEFPVTTAGAPTDADFYSLARDGLVCTDTTNNRLYTRTGGAWKYAALT